MQWVSREHTKRFDWAIYNSQHLLGLRNKNIRRARRALTDLLDTFDEKGVREKCRIVKKNLREVEYNDEVLDLISSLRPNVRKTGTQFIANMLEVDIRLDRVLSNRVVTLPEISKKPFYLELRVQHEASRTLWKDTSSYTYVATPVEDESDLQEILTEHAPDMDQDCRQEIFDSLGDVDKIVTGNGTYTIDVPYHRVISPMLMGVRYTSQAVGTTVGLVGGAAAGMVVGTGALMLSGMTALGTAFMVAPGELMIGLGSALCYGPKTALGAVEFGLDAGDRVGKYVQERFSGSKNLEK